MTEKRNQVIILAVTFVFIFSGCTLPGFSTPTPFSFPTPDKTMTALFEPTQAAPATSAATAPSDGESGEGEDDGLSEADLTATAEAEKPTATEEPTATPGETPTETLNPLPSITPTANYVGPTIRSGPSITATRLGSRPSIDGDLYDWSVGIQKVINFVVYGADKHTGELDASGTVVAGWDKDFLFLGIRVKDDKFVQKAEKKEMYLGDSIEILFDGNVSGDYYLQAMNSDDYQIGISPGKDAFALTINGKAVASMITSTATPACGSPCDVDPEAYIWYPTSESGKTTKIKVGVLESGKGYQVELKIPWDLLGVTPTAGAHYGFAISISDNDKAGTKNQQSMVSNVSTRYFADPTTWGDLYLKP